MARATTLICPVGPFREAAEDVEHGKRRSAPRPTHTPEEREAAGAMTTDSDLAALKTKIDREEGELEQVKVGMRQRRT